jgi:[protein-PII] uridylyltransferase
VRLHLLLPAVATGRDLADPETIEMVAGEVGSEMVLELLVALTAADSLATGPTAWTAWKAGLVDRLAEATRARLRRRPVDVDARHPLDTWAREAALRFDGSVRVEPHAHGAVIVAPDATGLLALEVATLGVHGQAVRRARTVTIGSLAVGDFEVEARHPTPIDWVRFREDLVDALADPAGISARLTARAERYSGAARPTAAKIADPRVAVDDAATQATVVEVRTADGIGVLYRITNALASLGIRVEQAFVSTLGHEVVDSFYVTDATGQRIDSLSARRRLVDTVLEALGGGAPAGSPGWSDSRHGSDQVR